MDTWCSADGIYLPKEAEAKQIGQFRPISLLNVDGKIYFGIIAKRTIDFLQNNGYIDEKVQKAGVPGIPGCIEHAYSIWGAIQEAKKDKLDLSIVWLDLANAYGSVPHKLIMKAMDHFFIPEKVQSLMKNYYDKFKMRFTTKNFTTDWHRLEVGIAAGCTISVIWFVLVMEMLLRSADLSEDKAMVNSPKKAFMDDVTLLCRDQEQMRNVLSRLEELIRWARMKFKAKKSRSLTFCKGKQKEVKFKISDEEMPTVKEQPVKSLGRWYSGTLTDRSRGIEVQKLAEDGLKAIDETRLPGKYKIWMVQFGLYPRLAWPLQMYEIALSRVEIIEQKINVKIRRWLGLPNMLNSAALYSRGGALELPLASISEIYRQGKIRTVMMLRESKDESIRLNPPQVKTARKWVAEVEADDIISELQQRDIVGAAQCHRAGLGTTLFKPFSTMNPSERRKSVSNAVRSRENERRRLHLVQCAVQGQVVRWEENIIERKISWKEAWEWTTSRMSFLVRSTYDVLPSPSNLVRWKLSANDRCRCGQKGTMKHVLSHCKLALDRYTWRHNQVLSILCETLKKQLGKINNGERPRKIIPQKRITFLKSGTQNYIKQRQRSEPDKRWDGNWQMAADLNGFEGFFPIPTSRKPDIFYWCDEKKVVTIVELTVPHEDNIDAAAERKIVRYQELMDELEEAGWYAVHYPVEVGCRGFMGKRIKNWFLSIGLKHQEVNKVIRLIQETVEKASHWIWLKREDQVWVER